MNKDFIPLVKAAEEGSESAFEELYSMTREMSYFMALSITHDEQDALDIMQESYFKAFSNLKALKSPEKFDNWLCRIVSNTGKSHMMQKKPMFFESISDEAMYEIKDEQNSDLVPHEFVEKEETSRLIMEIINKLSEEKRLVILMYYYQEMSTAEIAEALEMPLTTVKYKLLVARREIKEELEKLDRNGTRLYSALPLTVLPSVLSKAAQGINAPAFSAISQSVLGASAAAAGTVGVSAAKTGVISMIFKTTMAKVITTVLAVAVVGGGVTAAVVISKNNGNNSQTVYSQTVYDKNDKDESGDNGSEDNRGDSSNLSEESKMPDIPESPASDFEYTVENDEVIINKYIGSDTEVSIPEKIAGKPVTEIGETAFYFCTGLTDVDIPDSVTKIGEKVFFGCTRLKSVTIPDSVTEISNFAFYCSTGLTEINVSSDNPLYSSQDGVLFNKDKKTLICYPAGKENTSYSIPNSVTEIGKYAFYYCTGLTSVNIPDSVTEIGEGAFCFGTSVADIKASLTDINVSGDNLLYSSQDGVLFNKDKTTLICYPAGKENTSYSIPNSVAVIGNAAFEGCTSLTSVDIPNSVTEIGETAFCVCTSLTSVKIPDSVTVIGNNSFDSCKSLTNIEISNSLTEIGDNSFNSCTSLTSVDIPDSVTVIGNDAFYNCTSLTSVDIPNSVTEIGECAFFYCKDLTSVTIPAGVTEIGSQAFWGCDSLTSVEIPNSVTEIGDEAFGYAYDYYGKKISGFTIYGKAGSAAETYANDNDLTFMTD